MAQARGTKLKTTQILITILIIGIVLYLIYVWMQSRRTREGGESGEWYSFNWGGSQSNGTEVMFHNPNWREKSIQQILSVGDNVEIDISGCASSLAHITQDPSNICNTKNCVCRGDLSGVHEVVGLGDDSGGYMDSGFRIMADWQGSSSPTPSIANGRFRKVAKNTGWW